MDACDNMTIVSKKLSHDMSTLLAFINKRSVNNKLLKHLEQRSGFNCAQIILGGLGTVLMLLFLGIGSRIISYFVGCVYPVYMSFKALQSPSAINDRQWLTYWIVYSVLTTSEVVTDFFLSWFPFYYISKIALLLWCILPQTRGAELLYTRVFEPVMRKYAEQAEKEIECLKSLEVFTPARKQIEYMTTSEEAFDRIMSRSTAPLEQEIECPSDSEEFEPTTDMCMKQQVEGEIENFKPSDEAKALSERFDSDVIPSCPEVENFEG